MEKDITDSELLMLIHEKNEDAEKILYERYIKYINILIKKYKSVIKTLDIDYNEVYLECLKNLSLAINNYSDSKNVTFKTYAYTLINNKILDIIKLYNKNKYKMLQETISLNSIFDNNIPLKELLHMEEKLNPLNNVLQNDKEKKIIELLKNNLSNLEYKVAILLIIGYNQVQIAKYLNIDIKKVYNTTYRIKAKMANFLEEIIDI